MDKEVRKLVAQLDRIPDVEVRLAGSGHMVVTKGGAFVTTLSSTPSDVRWKDNALATLRRAGITPGVRQPKRSVPSTIKQMDVRAELAPIREARQISQFARFAQQLGEIRGLRTFKTVESAAESIRRVVLHDGNMEAWGWTLVMAALVEWRRRKPEPEPEQAVEVSQPPVTREQAGVKLVVDLDRLVAKLAEFGIDLEVR